MDFTSLLRSTISILSSSIHHWRNIRHIAPHLSRRCVCLSSVQYSGSNPICWPMSNVLCTPFHAQVCNHLFFYKNVKDVFRKRTPTQKAILRNRFHRQVNESILSPSSQEQCSLPSRVNIQFPMLMNESIVARSIQCSRERWKPKVCMWHVMRYRSKRNYSM